MLRDTDIYEYLVARGCSERLVTSFIEGCPDWIEIFRMDRGWLSVPLWVPITSDRYTFLDFNRCYVREKYEFLYAPAFETALGSVADEGLRDVFVLGGETNYFHMLMDFLPRLYLFAVTPELAQQRIIIGSDLLPVQHELIGRILRQLGIAAPQFVPLGPGVHRMENAYVPSNVTRGAAAAIWTHYFCPAGGRKGGGPERLFVLRGSDKRRLLNQEAIAEELARNGFHCADPGKLPFDEQVSLFGNARVIVGAHGAALTNLLFAPEGAAVFELYVNVRQPHFQNIAAARGLRHTYIAGMPAAGGAGWHNDAFTVDAGVLLQSVRPLLD